MKTYDGKKICSHQLAEKKYTEVKTLLDCTPQAVFNRQKYFHNHHKDSPLLTKNLNDIFDESEANHKILNCKTIKDHLYLKCKISFTKLYAELKNGYL